MIFSVVTFVTNKDTSHDGLIRRKKTHFRALVRSDGKILSSVENIRGVDEDEDTVLTATIQDGYLVGLAQNVYFEGKGKYPIYDFKD